MPCMQPFRFSVPGIAIDSGSQLFTPLEGGDHTGDLRNRFMTEGKSGDVWGDRDIVVFPERMFRRKRFARCDIQHGGTYPAFSHGAKQVVIHEMFATPQIDEAGAMS